MKKIIQGTLFVFLFLATHFTFAANSPIGYWQAVDDKTGEVRSIVKIYAAGDGTLQGKVVKVLPQPGVLHPEMCTECKGKYKNKSTLGLVIIWGMKQKSPTFWDGGKLLDPRSDHVYSGSLTMLPNGNLNLRGYIGISILGRTVTWYPARMR